MLIGHNAVAFAAKRIVPKTSLGTLTAAVMLPDLIWPIFLLLGIEHVRIANGATKFTPLDFYDYPWTHSLAMSIAWGMAFGVVYFARTRYARGGIVVALCVVSQFVAIRSCKTGSSAADIGLAPCTFSSCETLMRGPLVPESVAVDWASFGVSVGFELNVDVGRR